MGQKQRASFRGVAIVIAAYLGAGTAITVLAAFASAGWVDVGQAAPLTAQRTVGDERWEVSRWDRPAATAVLSVRHRGLNWSPRQATGPPDTPAPGDQVTAWAAALPSSPGDWLELDYARAVVPRGVRVYETYHPGAVVRVTAFQPDGTEAEAWRGTDPTPPSAGSGASDIPLSVSFPTDRVRIYIDSVKVPGWNEIDAVGLVGPAGDVQWARDARASSYYGSASSSASAASAAAPGPADLLPAWAGAGRPGRALEDGSTRDEVYLADARGWPMLALSSRRALPPSAAAAYGSPPAALYPAFSSSTYTTALSLSGSGFMPLPGSGTVSLAGGSTGLPPPTMPLRPVWPGFLVDAVFYAGALALLRWLLTAPRRLVREVSRMRQGRCIDCGYDLGYDFVRGCPECGWRRGAGRHTSFPSPAPPAPRRL